MTPEIHFSWSHSLPHLFLLSVAIDDPEEEERGKRKALRLLGSTVWSHSLRSLIPSPIHITLTYAGGTQRSK